MFNFKINPLFFLVLFLFIIAGLKEKIIIGFVLVTLHEFSHMLAAKKLGYEINKIELFPFGGVAEYKGLLEMEPYHEIIIALAGPVLNFILAGLFLIIDYDLLIKYNLVIGIFNLIPALPLDGGRVLRGIIVTKIGFKRGSFLTIKIAQCLAVIGFIIGIIAVIYERTNIWILFISFFVYGAAVKEKKQVIYSLLSYLTQRKQYIENIHLKKVMSQVVEGEMYLKDVFYYLIPDKFNIFYVLDKDCEVAGMITEKQLLDNLFSIKNRNIQIIEIVEN